MQIRIPKRRIGWQWSSEFDCWRGPWSWPWWNKSYDDDYEIWSHFAGVGPFQFHWYGDRYF